MLDIASKNASMVKKKGGYQPQSFFLLCSKAAIRKPFVKISPIFSDDCTHRMLIEGESFERNQWYFTAKCFDLGVTPVGSSFANFSAATLSSHTRVFIVDIICLGRPMLEHRFCNRLQNGRRSLIEVDKAMYSAYKVLRLISV